jgi:hypothetical protein
MIAAHSIRVLTSAMNRVPGDVRNPEVTTFPLTAMCNRDRSKLLISPVPVRNINSLGPSLPSVIRRGSAVSHRFRVRSRALEMAEATRLLVRSRAVVEMATHPPGLSVVTLGAIGLPVAEERVPATVEIVAGAAVTEFHEPGASGNGAPGFLCPFS